MLKEIKNSLKELGLGENEIKVYIALTRLGEGTAANTAKKADLPRTTAISILNKLIERNYVSSHLHKGKTYFWVEAPKTISSYFEKKAEIAQGLNKALGDLYRQEPHFPHMQVFDTKTGIKNFIEKFLANLERNSVLYTMDNPKIKNYDEVYSEKFSREKVKKGILTQTLIPYNSFEDIEGYKLKRQSIKIKEMPETINFEASLWISKNMIVHFSGNPLMAVAIKHDAIFKSIKSIYDFLWNVSIPKN